MNLPAAFPSHSKWIENFARFGLSAKGFVYVLSGVITFMAAFGLGNVSERQASNTGIFSFLHDQPFGKILLTIVAAGLVCYTGWRFMEAINDTEHKGSDRKGMSKRAAYIFSGIGYAGLAFLAIKFLLTNRKGNGDSQQQFATELLSKPFGQWLVAIVAIVIICVGAWQAYLAISGKYKKHVQQNNLSGKSRGLLLRAGKAGYISRAIVWAIIGWLFIKAAWSADANQAGGTQQALSWLKDVSYGPYLLGAVGTGLICYGIFMFVRARYQPIHTG